MGVVDVMMVGRLPDSAAALGAVSVGTSVFYTIAIFGGSLMMALDTLVSQAWGAKRIDECHRWLWSALALSIPVIPLVMAAVWAGSLSLGWFGVNPAVLDKGRSYVQILTFGVPGLFLYFALRRYLQGIGRVRIVTFALVSANVVNLVGNWGLIYGRWGLPAMGTDGSAWATVGARFYMAAVLAAYLVYIERRDGHGLFAGRMHVDMARMKRIVQLGGPAAIHVGLEMAVFGLATVLVARLAPEILAAHQIALNLASLTFMVPLGISAAAAVSVGHRIGAGDYEGAGRSGWLAIALGAAFMSLAALVSWLAPQAVARLYTDNSRVVATSVGLLAIAALFQLFDGLQIVCSGALRGAGDTRTAMLCNLVFYWFVGLPAGYALCFWAGWGAVGIWIGLCLGLMLIGSTLLWVWRQRVAEFRRQAVAAAA